MELTEIRKKINEVDEKMASAFEERMHLVNEVIKYKMEHNLPIYDEKREFEVLNKNISLIKDDELKEYFKEFLIDMMNVSKKYQQEILERNEK